MQDAGHRPGGREPPGLWRRRTRRTRTSWATSVRHQANPQRKTTMSPQTAAGAPRDAGAHLPPLTASAQAQFWNSTRLPFPDCAVHVLVGEQVARTPDAVAVEHGSLTMTYAELDERAGALAASLRAHGVSTGDRAVSYTHLRAHETDSYLVCRLLLEK